MKISLNWLSNYINLDGLSVDEIENRLTLLGLEVDEILHVGSKLEGVVIGEVLTCQQHPNANKLKVTTVDIGESEPVQIVCGAPNVDVAQKVPVATVGSTLPIEIKPGTPLKIKKSKIRGEVSMGMICAVDELGLGEDHSGIWVLDTNASNGTPLNEVVELFSDTVYDIAITPNRPDATCHVGVARDLAAYYKRSLTLPKVNTSNSANLDSNTIKVTINDPEKCHRYTAKIIEDVKVIESPQWLKNALTSVGLRPINAIVDATNYVMYEMGQPLHAFDLEEIKNKEIIVQSFKSSTKFTTLDSIERDIPENSLFICDGPKPVALAGVMGGENSEINDRTTRVLLESAYFEPTSIRKTAKSVSLQTDSSYRFERGIDPNITAIASERCAQMIAELTGGRIVDGILDIHPTKTNPLEINLSIAFTNRVIGADLSKTTIIDILNRLQFSISESVENEDLIAVTIPTFRPDIERPIDLVEEVARLYDYNNIESPQTTYFHTPSPFPYHEVFTEKVREAWKNLGYNEFYNNSLLPERYSENHHKADSLIRAINPISKDLTYLRDSLKYGILKTISFNTNRGNDSIQAFEIGHVFEKSEDSTFIESIKEHTHLGLVAYGFKHLEEWHNREVEFSFADLKSTIHSWLLSLRLGNRIKEELIDDVLHFKVRNTIIGTFEKIEKSVLSHFDIDKPVYYAEFDLTEIEKLTENQKDFKAKAISKYPEFEFDLALVVDKSLTAAEIEESLKKAAGSLLNRFHVFDVFEGGNLADTKKSIAYRLVFKDENKTLSMNDVDPIIQKVIKKMEKDFNATLR